MSLGEFQLISKYFAVQEHVQKVGACNAYSEDSIDTMLKLGIGDDAAILQGFGSQSLNISVDTLVEAVHFPINANPYLLAKRALRVNLSDMAAMGASPKWFTLALTLPSVDETWLEGFSKGLHEDAAKFGCALIGGDTTKGPLNIGLQIMGLVDESKQPIRRSGAKAGDYLVVTGTLGDAGAALDYELNVDETGLDYSSGISSPEHYFLQRYWLPSPRVEFAQKAAHLIHAACDISDGLLADAGHLCKSSQLSVKLNQNQIPVSQYLEQVYKDAKTRAAVSGDDYELCMAVPPDSVNELQSIAGLMDLPLTVIGEFYKTHDQAFKVSVVDFDGTEVDAGKNGYTHF